MKANILASTKCFVLDMDGTIYLGDQLFSYTHDFLRQVKSSGRKFIFFTNNSSKKHSSYMKKLHQMGIEIEPSQMLLSTQVILDHLQKEKQGKRVWVAGTADLLTSFREAGIEPQSSNPEIVIIGFDTTLTYDKLNIMHQAVRNGAEFFGINMDWVCPTAEGDIPDCGSMAQVIAASTGVQPRFFGKPSPHTMAYICTQTGYSPGDLCFVGDRMYTDIAVTQGTAAISVLVLSGESKEDDIARFPDITPTIVVKDLSELSKYF